MYFFEQFEIVFLVIPFGILNLNQGGTNAQNENAIIQ